MPRPARWSRDAVIDAASRQHGLLTAAQLAELGVARSTLSRSHDLGGMFSRVLPGVHAVQAGRELTYLQRDQAALLYAGPLSVITSRAALAGRRLAAAETPVLDGDGVRVLIPHTTRRVSAGFVVVERTRFMPAHHERDGLRYSPVARAVLDASRRCRDEGAVRALVFEAVQRGLTSPEALDRERRSGQMRGSRFTRLALEEVWAGIRSVPEGDLRRAFQDQGLDDLEYNPRLFLLDQTFLAAPDVYDPTTGVCLEVDSREHHFSVASWESTMERHRRMTAAGLAVLHSPPSQISRNPDAIVGEFMKAVIARAGHPAPHVRVVSSTYRPGR
ncbi:MAG TPA: type IV toxin-antitoxin system AbiEi family antitoxin domain-containing protein [Candidatus Nanopelagicales bacterium]|nr:type IV toxin-antitoxin system AbiEi family antitoxin domain-containing protein [Candidatus Nanopelagicales bacterium]